MPPALKKRDIPVTDEANTQKEDEQGKADSAPTGKAQPISPVTPPITGASPQDQVPSKLETEKAKDVCDKSKEICVRVIKDNKLTTFEDKTLFWGRIGIIFTIATLVVGTLTLIVFYFQLKLTQTQLQEAESDGRNASRHARQQIRALQSQVEAIQTQMRQDQRPYISLILGGPGPDKKFEISMPKNILHLPLKMTVLGKTPARHVHGRLFLEVVNINQAPLLERNTAPALDAVSGVVFPNVPQEINAIRMKAKKGNKFGEFDLLKESEYRDLLAYRSYLAAYGTYTYDDAFDIHHWTKFCVSFQASGPIIYPTPGCVQYNEVDNNQ